jgi:hypothetical protein
MWENGGIASLFSALDGGEWSASRLGRFNLREKRPSYWIGGWVGPRASLGAVEKRKYFFLSGIERRSSSP